MKRLPPAAGQANGGVEQQAKQRDKYTTILARIAASPRYVRASNALIAAPVSRRKMDAIVGTTNAPHYIQMLRELGLSILTERVRVTDRDKRPTWFGVYHLDKHDRQRLREMLGGAHEPG